MFQNALALEAKVEKYKKNAAMGEFLPKVGMNATFFHFDKDIKTEVSSLNLNGESVSIPNLTIQDKNFGVFGFNAVWNIFTGGKIIAMNLAARAELLGSNLKYKALADNLTTKLVTNYYGLALAYDVSAVKNNPDFKQTEVQKKLAQANYRANAASYSPMVSLFDGFSRYNNLKSADAQRQEVKYLTIAAKNDIESLVVKNYNELKKFQELYESTDKSIEDAEESLRCANLAFKEGYGTCKIKRQMKPIAGITTQNKHY